MVASTEDRLTSLELELERTASRLALLERKLEAEPEPRVALAPTAPTTVPAARPQAPLPPAPAPAPRTVERRTPDLEELLGGRLLALVGGVAVLLGLVFLVALAIERGWVGETMRVVLALAGSGGLVLAGTWLYDRRGQTQAALAAAGTGIAGLFLSLTAATTLYSLMPAPLGLVLAFGVGALATLLAVRWDSRTIAGLGILGALLSPALADGLREAASIAYLAVALAAAAGVLLWRRWEWLRVAAVALATAQVAIWVSHDGWDRTPLLLLVLSVFALLNLAAALGYELRVPPVTLRASTSLLVTVSALVVGSLGAVPLVETHGPRAAGIWLAAVAIFHLAAGLVTLARRAEARNVGLLLLAVALAAGDLAFAFLVDGSALAIGWAASAALLAGLLRRRGFPDGLVAPTAGAQLVLASIHVLMFDAPSEAFGPGSSVEVAFAPVVAVGLSAFACARLAVDERGTWRLLADALSALTLAYLTGLALDGPALVLAWAGEAIVLAQIARRHNDPLAAGAGVFFLALAGVHTIALEAPPEGLVYGVESLGGAALSLGAVAVAAWRLRDAFPGSTLAFDIVSGVALLFLASLAIVDAFQPGTGTGFETSLDVGIRQQGQMLLSAFWALTGFAALWLGLRRDLRTVRLAAFGLLALAVGKVFLYDLATLEAELRVLSFVVLGLLLLAGGFAYQRMRRTKRSSSEVVSPELR